jgi:hypothetical protein
MLSLSMQLDSTYFSDVNSVCQVSNRVVYERM